MKLPKQKLEVPAGLMNLLGTHAYKKKERINTGQKEQEHDYKLKRQRRRRTEMAKESRRRQR
jgi:phosphoribosylaminoimidazole carboxylase (NCAIR synthetase)